MRLLNTSTLELEEVERPTAPYAILSHVWTTEEVILEEILNPCSGTRNKAGFLKVQKCCAEAKARDLTYVWIDTCCIDKRSSAELTEAINSMYRWYHEAAICFVYLEDVPPRDIHPTDVEEQIQAFKESKWFGRGWTLQELVASSTRLFFAEDWSVIDVSTGLNELVAEISGINVDVLRDRDKLFGLCVAERMSWQSRRQTTREEDIAYSLMGIFSVSMSIVYGEGGRRAFRRLQEEIIKTSFDHTIFAWPCHSTSSGLLAPSPSSFANVPTLGLWKASILSPFRMTNAGLRLQLMLVHHDPPLIPGVTFAILACDAKTEHGWGNILIRLEQLKDVNCYMNDRKCRVFRRIGSATPDFTPFNAFKVSYEDVVVFEDEQYHLMQTAAKHTEGTWSQVKMEGRLRKFLISGCDVRKEDSQGPDVWRFTVAHLVGR